MLLFVAIGAFAQKTPGNLVVVTLDGFRWQEMFGGVDSELMNSKDFTRNVAAMKDQFWAETPEARREKLLPFFWTKLAKEGQIHGNRHLGSKVSPTNDVRAMWLDGSFVNSGANDLGVIAASTDRPFSVGGGSPTAGNLTGQIAELLYLKRLLTAAEDADLTQYLNARYGLSLTGVTQ